MFEFVIGAHKAASGPLLGLCLLLRLRLLLVLFGILAHLFDGPPDVGRLATDEFRDTMSGWLFWVVVVVFRGLSHKEMLDTLDRDTVGECRQSLLNFALPARLACGYRQQIARNILVARLSPLPELDVPAFPRVTLGLGLRRGVDGDGGGNRDGLGCLVFRLRRRRRFGLRRGNGIQVGGNELLGVLRRVLGCGFIDPWRRGGTKREGNSSSAPGALEAVLFREGPAARILVFAR